MSSQESEANEEYELRVSLFSRTPVVACQIIPAVQLTRRGPPFEAPPQHSFSFNWYRQMVCSVHPSKLAAVQCLTCVKLDLPVKQSCHCSPMCFSDAWQIHVEHHHRAAKTITQTTTGGQQAVRRIRSCGSWPDFSSIQILGENELVEEQEGKVWSKVGSSKIYEPTMDDVGLVLRLECSAVDFAGIQLAPVHIKFTDPVITRPPRCHRCMIKIGDYQNSSNIHFQPYSSDGLTFNVLSYNILADLYIAVGNYYYCPNWALVWEYRRQNLLQEIIEYDADILCLQEVQSDHFENFLKPELVKHGYSVMYKRKISEVFTASGYTSDGCATFYRHDLFKEVMKYELEFGLMAQSAIEQLKPELKHNARIRIMKDNVALIVILETIRNASTSEGFQSRICVANTHIHADTAAPDVKLQQVASLVCELEKITQSKIPLLMCGDFNSLPESDPHMLIVRGRINPVSGEGNDPMGIYQFLKLEHSLALVSAYAAFFHFHLERIEEKQLNRMNFRNREPLFTTFKPGFAGTLDYIFYTADSLRVEGLLELLDSKSLGSGLPSPIWSSDHLALMASFRLKPPSS